MRHSFRLVATAAAVGLVPATYGTEIRAEVGSTRAPDSWERATNAAARDFARHAAALSRGYRDSLMRDGVLRTRLCLPVRIVLTDRGQRLAFRGRGAGDIVPVFDTTGSRVFPSDYRDYLVRVFTAAKPAMSTFFGQPAVGGTVHIKNYDADIQDRYAVAGGYYLPNAPTGPEVRFPVYNNRVSAAVNYIHTLLLAYMGDRQYPWDAYNEGLARAATIVVCRTPGSIPDNPLPDEIEAALSGLYDVGTFYDWWNKPGLGGPRFIAPNLLNTQLPIGGSTGGVFLLRYQMAGTAWAKVELRYHGFIAEFNRRYYLNPAAYQTTAQLEALGQLVLDTVSGTNNAKIEGWSFSQWALRQAILDTRPSPGLKLLPTPVPITAQAGSSDFGVFDIVLNAFQSETNGDEVLLGGTAYPVYWRPDFTRFFTSAQDDAIRVAGAYGSVAPNFPGDTFQKQPYRVTVDLPFFGKNTRVVLPAGAYSTGTDPTGKSFIGTLSGFPDPGATPYTVKVAWTGGQKTGVPVTHNAFGFDVTDTGFLGSGPVTVSVMHGATEVLRREMVKTQGALFVDLVPASSEVTYAFTRPGRLDLVGLPLEPYRVNAADLLGLPDGQTLLARWDSTVARYLLYPNEGEMRQGLGYWSRATAQATRAIIGHSVPGIPVAVSLNPGWNQVAVPFDATVTTQNILVTVAAEAVGTYDQAVADGTLGPTIFRFFPDPSDPDAGTMVAATSLAPGKSYFVRANRPEGAVLLFVPNGGTRGAKGSGRTPPHYTPVWKCEVTLLDGRGRESRVTIGQSVGASRRYDLALDSDLPPLLQGLQLAVMNGGPMYKDVRAQGSSEQFALRSKGLLPGRTYVLRFRPSGQCPTLLVTDRGRQYAVRSNQDYVFVAGARDMAMTVVTR